MGYPPWHMWGTSHQLQASTTLAVGNAITTQQLTRIDYARPETWNFIFQAVVNSYTGLFGSKCTLFFDIFLGLGRSAISIPAFETYVFEFGGSGAPPPGQMIWSSQVQGPPRFEGDTVPNPCDDFVAQSINCNARALMEVGSGANVAIDLTVNAAFAPASHIRPEWFSPTGPAASPRFRGGEQGGM